MPSLNSKWSPFIVHPFPYPKRVVGEWQSLVEDGQESQRFEHPIHMAFRWQRMLEQDEKLTMRRIARKEGISSTRVYQVMNFLKMPEDVQAYLKSTRDRREVKYLNEKRLRKRKLKLFRKYWHPSDNCQLGRNCIPA